MTIFTFHLAHSFVQILIFDDYGEIQGASSLFFITRAVAFFAWVYYGSQKRYTVDNFVQDLQQADLDEKSYCEKTAAMVGPKESDVDSKEMLDKRISVEVLFTNQVYVSRVIKEKCHCSFSDYINRKRIDFSMELMRSDPTLTQDIIAEKSGFINAQFYSWTFKKMVGIPPKEWLSRNIYCS